MTLTTRLLLLVALAVLPALLLLGYNEYDLRRTRSAEVREQVVRSANDAAARVRDAVNDAQRLSAVIAKLPQVRSAATTSTYSDTCSELLVKLRQDYPGELEFGIANTDGLIVCTTRGTRIPIQVEGAHPRRAMETNGFVVGGYSVSRATSTPYLSFAYPVRDDAGMPIGAVVAGLNLKWLTQHIGALFHLPDAVLSIHDLSLVFLSRVPDEAGLIGKPPPPSVQSLSRFANKGIIEAQGADGLSRIGVISTLSFRQDNSGEPDLHVAVGLSQAAVFEDLNERTRRGLFLVLFITALAVIAGMWGGRRFIRRPVEDLLAAARRWRDGHYQTRVELRDRSSEFGRLATAYEEMADGLAERDAERDRAQQQLRESEERLRMAQEAGAVGLWDWDLRAGKVHRVGTIYRAWGLPEGPNVTPNAFYEVVHADDRERLHREREAALRGEVEVYESEYRIIDPVGAVRWVASRGEVIRDGTGVPVRMIGINRDVTDRREALEALARINADLEQQVEQRTRESKEAMERLYEAQKMESIGQLTGGIAHDFNNLLMATLGSLSLLRKRLPEDPKAHRFLENAIQGAERGALLTQRLLAFARRQELKPEAVDVQRLVKGMSDLLGRSLGPSVQIITEFPEQMPPAQVDAAQLELAVLNLCINARDAMPDGGPITISARTEILGPEQRVSGLAPGRYVCISIADKGIGMDEATVARATEPFFTTKGVGKGTGLGLSMAAGLAAQSGGVLRVLSRVGEGTTIEIWLRQANAPPLQASTTGTDTGVEQPAQRSLMILLVDDDALVEMGTASMLEDMGHAVLSASSAPRALEILRSSTPIDLVITDHAMPGMTGVELAQTIRKDWPGLRVILATGYAELSGDIGKDLPRLSKPYRPEQLASTIEEVMRPEARANSKVVQLHPR